MAVWELPAMSRPLEGVAISFDLDGTLVDTAPDLVRSTNVVMDATGLSRISLASVRGMVGQGARALIVKAAAASEVTFSDADVDKHVGHFLEIYKAGLTELSRPFDGVDETLELLAQQGAILSVCTNKPPHLANPVLEAFGLKRHFKAIVGNGQAGVNKPDARHLTYTIEACGGDVRRSLMVGDSITDVQAARNASIPVVLVSFGYTIEKASTLGADAVFDHYHELPELAARIMNS
jgi:phosphoglycolate phosphatase